MASGGLIAGPGSPTGDQIMLRPADGEFFIRPDGTVLKCHHCPHGYHFVPTGERIDMKAQLDAAIERHPELGQPSV